MTPSQSYTRNYLLRMLSDEDFSALQPHLERVELHLRQTLVEPGQPIEQVYFLEGGICSIVARQDSGEEAEAGLFGREGLSGTAILLGSESSPHRSVMQVNGNTALRMEAARLRQACENSRSLHDLLLRFTQTLTVQAAETAVANAHYTLPERLSRWLLMCHDRMTGNDIALTHEFMSVMLGVRRSGVTVTLHTLEGVGAIRTRRGTVTIVDRARLEEIAGASYGAPEAEYARLIGPLRKTSESSHS